MTTDDGDISKKIVAIFDENTTEDLKRFLRKRRCLNKTNSALIYLFHFIQSAGIFITSYSASSNNPNLIWIGVALNFLASLIHVYENTNNSILRKIMADIQKIKNGNYVDEGELIDPDKPGASAKYSDAQNPKRGESVNMTEFGEAYGVRPNIYQKTI